MGVALFFWALVIICCTYGAYFGGRTGRWLAVLLIGASLLTLVAQSAQTMLGGAIWPIMLVDLLLFAGLYWLAMRSNRFWPLWVAGFHLITLTTHLAVLLAPSFAARVYIGLATFWSIPGLIIILIGVTMDRQAGIKDLDRTSPQA
ncbi:MAG: hypothetical protein AAFW97_04020 [Pseudomonadota bacterium]